jgi:hypothetical protein
MAATWDRPGIPPRCTQRAGRYGHLGYRLGHRIVVPVEQDDGREETRDRLQGPADFCAFPNKKGLMVVVPDPVKGALRVVRFGK